MKPSSLIYPMFAMVVLTGVVLVTVFRSRVRAVREGAIPSSYYRLYQSGTEPEYARKAGRHFSNLFEAPTLFYAGCLAAMATDVSGAGILILAWLYVAARIIHALIHLGGNRLRYRIRAYFAGWVVLAVLWVTVVVAVTIRP